MGRMVVLIALGLLAGCSEFGVDASKAPSGTEEEEGTDELPAPEVHDDGPSLDGTAKPETDVDTDTDTDSDTDSDTDTDTDTDTDSDTDHDDHECDPYDPYDPDCHDEHECDPYDPYDPDCEEHECDPYDPYDPDCEVKCTYTQGYWKNHAEAWPVSELYLGSRVYDAYALMTIFETTPFAADASIILAHQLIAAKLNVAYGADDMEIASTLYDADAWLTAYDDYDGLPLAIAPTSAEGAMAVSYADALDYWNNAYHCE